MTPLLSQRPQPVRSDPAARPALPPFTASGDLLLYRPSHLRDLQGPHHARVQIDQPNRVVVRVRDIQPGPGR